jgi:hypothetical protein
MKFAEIENKIPELESELAPLYSAQEIDVKDFSIFDAKRAELIEQNRQNSSWMDRKLTDVKFFRVDHDVSALKLRMETRAVTIREKEVELAALRETLSRRKEILKEECAAYVESRLQADREALIASLPQRKQEIVDLFFALCEAIGNLQVASSSATDTGNIGVTVAEVGEFFQNLGGEINVAWGERDLIAFPIPWNGFSIVVRPYVRPIDGVGKSPAVIVEERRLRKIKKCEREFYSKQNV